MAALDGPPKGKNLQDKLALPFPPVGRVYIDPLLGRRVDPATGSATGRKRERKRVTQYHSKFEIAVERRS